MIFPLLQVDHLQYECTDFTTSLCLCTTNMVLHSCSGRVCNAWAPIHLMWQKWQPINSIVAYGKLWHIHSQEVHSTHGLHHYFLSLQCCITNISLMSVHLHWHLNSFISQQSVLFQRNEWVLKFPFHNEKHIIYWQVNVILAL